MRFKEEQEAHLTTRQWYAKEARDDALLDGGRQMVARSLAKEEADINNNEYRQLRSVSRHRYIHVERGGKE
jgi:hypothetical protein